MLTRRKQELRSGTVQILGTITCYDCRMNSKSVHSFLINGVNREVVGNTRLRKELLHEREEPSAAAVLSLAAHSK